MRGFCVGGCNAGLVVVDAGDRETDRLAQKQGWSTRTTTDFQQRRVVCEARRLGELFLPLRRQPAVLTDIAAIDLAPDLGQHGCGEIAERRVVVIRHAERATSTAYRATA